MIISTNFSHLWQYLDPSRLLPTLLEKFLITEKDEKEANSYSGYAQTCIILRGLFSDYCPANRLFKLCDTLATIPGQEYLGEKLLQGTIHVLQVRYVQIYLRSCIPPFLSLCCVESIMGNPGLKVCVVNTSPILLSQESPISLYRKLIK